MSLNFIPDGPPTVTPEQLHAIASAHSIKIPSQDEKDYLFLLNSLDATLNQVADLPAYIDPRLKPEEATLPRKWKKAEHNPLNAWACQTDIKSPTPLDTRLAGRTIALKDNISIAGIPLTGGTSPEFLTGTSEPHVPTIDAVIVQRILQAGGTIAGSATCENFSMSPLSFTSATGPVHNPWLRGWTAGGSSSGPTALVAIKVVNEWRKRHSLPSLERELGEGVDMAIGCDQGGSIRIPAGYCGVYGLKATHGLIPYTGIMSLHPLLDHTGPLGGSLEDVAMLLGVLAGWDGMDVRMTPETPLRGEVRDYTADLAAWVSSKKEAGLWTAATAGKGLKIGIVSESLTVLNLSPTIKSAFHTAASRFTSLGATVSEISIPAHTLAPSIWTTSTRLHMHALGFQNHPSPLLHHPLTLTPPPFTQSTYSALTTHNPAVINIFLTATYLSQHPAAASLTAHAQSLIPSLAAAYDSALRTYDVLILPLNPTPGSPHPPLSASVGEKMALSTGATANTCPFNATGHPVLGIPIGWVETPEGGKVPTGMQIVGRKFGEEGVLRAGMVWEVGGQGLDGWDGR